MPYYPAIKAHAICDQCGSDIDINDVQMEQIYGLWFPKQPVLCMKCDIEAMIKRCFDAVWNRPIVQQGKSK